MVTNPVAMTLRVKEGKLSVPTSERTQEHTDIVLVTSVVSSEEVLFMRTEGSSFDFGILMTEEGRKVVEKEILGYQKFVRGALVGA